VPPGTASWRPAASSAAVGRSGLEPVQRKRLRGDEPNKHGSEQWRGDGPEHGTAAPAQRPTPNKRKHTHTHTHTPALETAQTAARPRLRSSSGSGTSTQLQQPPPPPPPPHIHTDNSRTAADATIRECRSRQKHWPRVIPCRTTTTATPLGRSSCRSARMTADCAAAHVHTQQRPRHTTACDS
jgi:hypothetical protein